MENSLSYDDYNYIYFIESHRSLQDVKLYIAKNYQGINPLEVANKIKNNPEFIITIYRFKVFPKKIIEKYKEPSKLEILLKIEDEESDTFDKIITNLNIFENNYLYNIQFENTRFLGKKKPPESLKLSYKEQFKIYINYIRQDSNLNKKSEENEHLISSIQKLFDKNGEKFDFCSYLYVFSECKLTKNIKKQLELFNPEKINKIGNQDDGELSEISNKLNSLEKSFDKIFTTVDDEMVKNKYKIRLYNLIFFFNYCFYKERNLDLLNNKDINKFIYKGLYYYQKFYKNLELTENQIQEIINLSTNFELLSWALKFNKNTTELLQIITNNAKKFNEFFLVVKKKYENKEKFPIIDIGLLTKPKKEDNIQDIFILIEFLFKLISDEVGFIYIKFNPIFFEKYIDLFDGNNLEQLKNLRNLFNYIKKYDKNYKIKTDINKIIHETGLDLILTGKLNNMEILNYIKEDGSSTLNLNFTLDYLSLDIFEKIDINLIDESFLEEWKKIKWHEMYFNQYLEYINKVLNMIKEIKHFHILIKLISLKDEMSNKKYYKSLLLILQDKYLNLCKNFIETDIYPNFIDDSAEFIFYFTQKDFENDFDLLKKIQNCLPNNIVYDIYIKYLEKNENITKATQKIMINYIFLHSEKINSKSLYILIKKCPIYSYLIIPYFNKYLIKIDDMFLLEENENVKLLKDMLLSKMFFSEKDLIKDYYNYNTLIMDQINLKINNNDFIYNNLDLFFSNESNKKIFYDRLSIISLITKDNPEEKMNLILKEYIETKEFINDLELLFDNQKNDIKNTNNENLEKNYDLIEKIKNSNINFCKNNPILFEKYLPEIEKEKKKKIEKTSIIYIAINNKQKEIYKEDEDDSICYNESHNKLILLKDYLVSKKEITDNDLLDIIPYLKLNSEIIKSEVEKFIEIFDIEKDNDSYRKIMEDSLFFIFYKEKIAKLMISLKYIIEFSNVKKDILFKSVNSLISSSKKIKEINSIFFISKILKIYSIDIFDENDNFIQLMIKFGEYPESIKFLFNINKSNIEKQKQFFRNKENINILDVMFEFVNNIGDMDKRKNMMDKDLIIKFKEEAYKNTNIINEIKSFISLYGDIKGCIN